MIVNNDNDNDNNININWLQTNGVDTHGAAAEVIIFDRLAKKVRPGTFGNIQAG